MISRTITTHLPVDTNEAFEHLVFYKDCEKWTDPEEWQGLFFHLSENKLSGIEVSNPIPLMAPIYIPIEELSKGSKVVYGSSCSNKDNLPLDSMRFFPFREIRQSVIFRPNEKGCVVKHTIELLPKGILGHINCRLLVFPELIKDINKKNNLLQKHLKNVSSQS